MSSDLEAIVAKSSFRLCQTIDISLFLAYGFPMALCSLYTTYGDLRNVTSWPGRNLSGFAQWTGAIIDHGFKSQCDQDI